MGQNNQTLTSVKIDEDLWEEFKIKCIRSKFSFQKLAERAIFKYNNDEEFRKMIKNVNPHPGKLDSIEI